MRISGTPSAPLGWKATAESDFVVQAQVEPLEPGTRYYYKLLSGETVAEAEAGPSGGFLEATVELSSERAPPWTGVHLLQQDGGAALSGLKGAAAPAHSD